MNKMFCKASLASTKMMASTSGLPNVFPIKLCNLDDVLVRVSVNPDLRTYINLHSPTMIPAVTAIHSVYVNEKGGVYATEDGVSHVYSIAFSAKSQDLAMIPQNGHVEAYVAVTVSFAVASDRPPIIVLKTVNGRWVSATGECTVVGPAQDDIIVRVPNGDPYLIRTGASVSRSMCEKGDAPNLIRLYSRTYTQEVALYEERVAGVYDTPSPQPDPEPEATQPNSIRETGPVAESVVIGKLSPGTLETVSRHVSLPYVFTLVSNDHGPMTAFGNRKNGSLYIHLARTTFNVEQMSDKVISIYVDTDGRIYDADANTELSISDGDRAQTRMFRPEVRELSLLRDEITSILDSMVASHEMADARSIEGLPYRQSALGFISAASTSLKDAIAEFDAISDTLRTTSTDFTIQLNG